MITVHLHMHDKIERQAKRKKEELLMCHIFLLTPVTPPTTKNQVHACKLW